MLTQPKIEDLVDVLKLVKRELINVQSQLNQQLQINKELKRKFINFD